MNFSIASWLSLFALLELTRITNAHFNRKTVWFKAMNEDGSPITDTALCADVYSTHGAEIFHGKDIRFRDHVADGVAIGDRVSFCTASIRKGYESSTQWSIVEYEAQESNVISPLISVCENFGTERARTLFNPGTAGTECPKFCENFPDLNLTSYQVDMKDGQNDEDRCTCYEDCSSNVMGAKENYMTGFLKLPLPDRVDEYTEGGCTDVRDNKMCYEPEGGSAPEVAIYFDSGNVGEDAWNMDKCISLCKDLGYEFAGLGTMMATCDCSSFCGDYTVTNYKVVHLPDCTVGAQ